MVCYSSSINKALKKKHESFELFVALDTYHEGTVKKSPFEKILMDELNIDVDDPKYARYLP